MLKVKQFCLGCSIRKESLEKNEYEAHVHCNKPNEYGYWFLYDNVNNEWDVVFVSNDLQHYYTFGDDYKCSIAQSNNVFVKINTPNLNPVVLLL